MPAAFSARVVNGPSAKHRSRSQEYSLVFRIMRTQPHTSNTLVSSAVAFAIYQTLAILWFGIPVLSDFSHTCIGITDLDGSGRTYVVSGVVALRDCPPYQSYHHEGCLGAFRIQSHVGDFNSVSGPDCRSHHAALGSGYCVQFIVPPGPGAGGVVRIHFVPPPVQVVCALNAGRIHVRVFAVYARPSDGASLTGRGISCSAGSLPDCAAG